MSSASIDRRTLLQSGSVAAAAVAVGGFRPTRAEEAPLPTASAGATLFGPLVAWVVLDLDRGGVIRLVALDDPAQPKRTIATEVVPLMSPVAAARRARDLAVETVAASWGVRPESCVAEFNRIAHPTSGRAIGYAVWSDFT